MKMEEERLWFELDKIVVAESSRAVMEEERLWTGYTEKADAATRMMGFLKKPSPEQCRKMHIEDGE